MDSSKISVYSLPDLKSTTDEALPNFLNSIKFSQVHTLVDVHLALGYGAVAISAATFALDYKYGWDDTKAFTVWAVIIYFIFNGALTAWTTLVEKQKVYQGVINGKMVTISTNVSKHTPIYELEFESQDQKGKGKTETIKIKGPFAKWFTSDGTFVAPLFQEWMASQIPLVRQATDTLKSKKGK